MFCTIVGCKVGICVLLYTVIFVLIGKYFRSREKIFLKKFIELLMPATEKTNSGGPAIEIEIDKGNARLGFNVNDESTRLRLKHGITELTGWTRIGKRCGGVSFPISDENKLKIAHMLYEHKETPTSDGNPLCCTILVRRYY